MINLNLNATELITAILIPVASIATTLYIGLSWKKPKLKGYANYRLAVIPGTEVCQRVFAIYVSNLSNVDTKISQIRFQFGLSFRKKDGFVVIHESLCSAAPPAIIEAQQDLGFSIPLEETYDWISKTVSDLKLTHLDVITWKVILIDPRGPILKLRPGKTIRKMFHQEINKRK